MTELRAIFGEDADHYDRHRPGYPDALFDRLPAGRVLEIGCGTGKATVPLAERGHRVVAVELSPAMAAVARRNLARFPGVEVVVGEFETWPLPAEPFDLVLAATAFHWLDPTIRTAKAAAALRPGGTLAIVSTHHVAGGTTDFFAEVQRCYERFDPSTPPDLRLTPAAEIPEDTTDFAGWFDPVEFHRYVWDRTYTAPEYLALLMTYSGHRALAPDRRAGLFACITAMIDGNGGRITKRFMTELAMGQRH
ncbi:class I SAM-dependent methyltransferase [Saccharothrix variisporea]|uniref:Methyltransferase family protein n=1 Tax=Saccharothrix variisporea TaxID=543527 RepID=A0A495X665_9PSEU|nr:class I SAM-dependent methyltransferase [Saccharothrix variisporea]RKT69056.1 methyltransferase family protein [Saccharothrix variisporea]